MSALSDLRLKLVAAREDLHEDEAALVILEAKAEQEIIDALPGDSPEAREKALGPNAEARKRALAIRMGAHEQYQLLLRAIRRGKTWTEDLQARIDGLLDERKDGELAATERLIYVLSVSYGIDGPTARMPMAVAEREAMDRYMAQRHVPGLLDSERHEDDEEPAADALPGVPAEDDSRDIDDEHIDLPDGAMAFFVPRDKATV